jgi:hypothetical protein
VFRITSHGNQQAALSRRIGAFLARRLGHADPYKCRPDCRRTKYGRFRGRAIAQHHRAGLVTGHRAGVRTDRGVSDLCTLGTSISHLYHYVFGIRGVDNFIRVAMEDDRRNGTSALWAA